MGRLFSFYFDTLKKKYSNPCMFKKCPFHPKKKTWDRHKNETINYSYDAKVKFNVNEPCQKGCPCSMPEWNFSCIIWNPGRRCLRNWRKYLGDGEQEFRSMLPSCRYTERESHCSNAVKIVLIFWAISHCDWLRYNKERIFPIWNDLLSSGWPTEKDWTNLSTESRCLFRQWSTDSF